MTLPILIIGCGRSGTQYTAKLLTECGLDIGHEREGADGEANWMKTPNGRGLRLHQKRNALKVIASCTTFGDISWRIISEHIPLYPEESILKKCMKYYYFWNMIAERNTVFSYYVEQLPEIWDKFCEVIGHSLTYRDIPKNINTRQGEYPALSWRDLEREDPILCRLIRKQC